MGQHEKNETGTMNEGINKIVLVILYLVKIKFVFTNHIPT